MLRLSTFENSTPQFTFPIPDKMTELTPKQKNNLKRDSEKTSNFSKTCSIPSV